MSADFRYDVFLSHSAKDKAVVRLLAERLRQDGLKVWFDEWVLKPGDNIPAKIEEGLEQSRVLVLCMSAHAFGSDWAQLEAGTFRFRDPLNRERRFIPLRLDDAPIRGSLAQFLHINWRPAHREQEYAKLLEGCRPPAKPGPAETEAASEQAADRAIELDSSNATILAYQFSPDAKSALSCGDAPLRLWDLETGRCLRVLEGPTGQAWSLAWSADQRRVLAGAGHGDEAIRLLDLETGRCLRLLEGHKMGIGSVAWSADQRRALSGADDATVRVWDVETGHCLAEFAGHTSGVKSVAWSADQRRIVSGARDRTVRLWDVKSLRCLRVLEGHMNAVSSLVWGADQCRILSGSWDMTLRLWDIETGRCLCVLEGHT